MLQRGLRSKGLVDLLQCKESNRSSRIFVGNLELDFLEFGWKPGEN